MNRNKNVQALTAQLERLGCTGQRDTITVSPVDDLSDIVALSGEGSEDQAVEVAAGALAELLAYLPSDAPIAEGEDGVWDVIESLRHDRYANTLRWLIDDLGLTKQA